VEGSKLERDLCPDAQNLGNCAWITAYFREYSTCLINAVVSMGRRNTGPKSNLQMFQRLNSFESADSKKTLPCLGLIEYSPKDQVSLKNTIGSTD
jgi:hypothetical protein